MAKDFAAIIRSLQTTAVNRCRERLDEAAVRARDKARRGDDGNNTGSHDKPEYGVTSVLKRRHGL